VNSAINRRKSLTSSKLFSNCSLSNYIEIHPPPQFSPTSLTQPKASHHPTGNATSHDHVRQPVGSPAVPRPTAVLTSGLERKFLSSFYSDISDLFSAEHSAASGHQQWVLAGDSNGGHFSPSSSQPPIYNNMASSGRRRKSYTRLCTLQTRLTDTHTTSDK
jgi:hypothetical protein